MPFTVPSQSTQSQEQLALQVPSKGALGQPHGVPGKAVPFTAPVQS